MTESGECIDKYGSEDYYYYSLPQFCHSETTDLQRINEQNMDFFYPIVEAEQSAVG